MNDKNLKDWLEGNLSEEQANQLKQDDDFESIDKILEGTERLNLPQGKDKNVVWESLFNEIEEEVKPNSQKAKVFYLRPVWQLSGVAASLLILLCSYIFLAIETVHAPHGEKVTHTFPDNSEVILNAGSSIQFKKFFWEYSRNLSLEGEAFFKVKTGNDFIVKTPKGTVSVLGTSFNVYSRENAFEVACYEGKVKVNVTQLNAVQQEEILLPMEKTTLSANGLIKSSFEGAKQNTWLEGQFSYENADFGRVIAELERQFDCNIIFSELMKEREIGKEKYTGYFDNKELEEALQLTVGAMGLNFQIEGKSVIVE